MSRRHRFSWFIDNVAVMCSTDIFPNYGNYGEPKKKMCIFHWNFTRNNANTKNDKTIAKTRFVHKTRKVLCTNFIAIGPILLRLAWHYFEKRRFEITAKKSKCAVIPITLQYLWALPLIGDFWSTHVPFSSWLSTLGLFWADLGARCASFVLFYARSFAVAQRSRSTTLQKL